jgi:hypothetical protein
MAKQDEYVRYTIRVPEALYRRLQDAAGHKSVNAEIVARLERMFAIEDQNAESQRRWARGENVNDDAPPPGSIEDYGQPARPEAIAADLSAKFELMIETMKDYTAALNAKPSADDAAKAHSATMAQFKRDREELSEHIEQSVESGKVKRLRPAKGEPAAKPAKKGRAK